MLMRRYYPVITRNLLEPIDIVNGLEQTRKQLHRLFNDTNVYDNDTAKTSGTFPIELTETPDAYQLKALIPGVDSDQIDVHATEDTLTLQIDWEQEHLNTDSRQENTNPSELEKTTEQTLTPIVHIREFQYGKMERTIQFAQPIANDQIEAQFKNGVLLLSIPKINASKKRPVKISIR